MRLSEVLATAERQGIVLELNAALCLIRQLVSAVAAFHEAAPDSCHGAIAPERIVLTQDGRLVVVEYVLGPALEELHFSQERYWRELGIALPHTFGLPRFDLFADVTQIGAVALALVLGRRLHGRGISGRISDVVDHASTPTSSRGQFEPLPVLLRAWLRSALQLEPRHSFVSAIGAKKELEIALSHASQEAERASLRTFLAKYTSVAMADRSAEFAGVTTPAPVEPPRRPPPCLPPPCRSRPRLPRPRSKSPLSAQSFLRRRRLPPHSARPRRWPLTHTPTRQGQQPSRLPLPPSRQAEGRHRRPRSGRTPGPLPGRPP